MNYLLDTCVISELVKLESNRNVVSWIGEQREESLFLSSITVGEIQKGISLLNEDARKKNRLQSWLDDELPERFRNRILSIDVKVARKWGEIMASAKKRGRKMPVVDSLIASIGLAFDMTVVTRNVRDMETSGVKLFNPWEKV